MPTKNNKLILVTGATGHQGGAVLRHLQKRGFPVRAITRDLAKRESRALLGAPRTELVRADLNDPPSITRALDGADAVYSVQISVEGAEPEIRQGINLADAANRAGISHFVYSSVYGADQNTGVPHFESKFRIEQHIHSTGLGFTILRPVFFMDNWLNPQLRGDTKDIVLPLRPDTRLQMIAASDIGAVAAMAFEHPGRWKGRTIDLAGDDMTLTQIAESLSRAEGREVRYVQVPWDQFEKQAGPGLTRMFHWIEEHGMHADIPAVRAEHRELMAFERWLHTQLQPA